MVKVGILDADVPMAGEIIRILINHPETELVSLIAPGLMGRNISSVHHGVIGEDNLNFTDKVNLDDIDLLIMMQANELAHNIINQFKGLDDLHLIVFGKEFQGQNIIDEFEIGLSEINRKALVRGAKSAYIPSPVIVPSLISLIPLAHFLLLNSDIDIEISLPEDLALLYNESLEAAGIEKILKKYQTSFNGKVNLKINSDHQTERGIRTHISFQNSLPVDEIEKIYDQIYDDHNFTFISRNEVNSKEVEGTQKTIINIDKPEADMLVIESVADARLRGGAGDAVHVLNLFFGLHEKTGLNLKPSRF